MMITGDLENFLDFHRIIGFTASLGFENLQKFTEYDIM